MGECLPRLSVRKRNDQRRMVFVGDFAGEAETRKEAIEREIEWLKEEKKQWNNFQTTQPQ